MGVIGVGNGRSLMGCARMWVSIRWSVGGVECGSQ